MHRKRSFIASPLNRPLITLTRPPVIAPKWGLNSGLLVPPLGLAYLAASLRQHGFPVAIVDPVGEAPFELHPVPGRPLVSYGWGLDRIVAAVPSHSRYIGVSCTFSQEWPFARELLRKLRQRFPQAVLIAGGEHVTAAPDFSLRDCTALDSVVLGEGEQTLLELVRTLEGGGDVSTVAGLAFRQAGKVVRTPSRPRIGSLEGIPWPAWDLVPIETYLRHGLTFGVGGGRTMPIMATRGCPYRCTFCSSPQMWTQRWLARSPQDVVAEMESYVHRYGATNFDFYDLTAILRRDWIIAFCQELLRRGLKVSWQLPAGTRSEVVDDEVVALLARTGHRNLVFAPETGSERLLGLIHKQVRLPRMLASMRAAVRHGISVKLNMILGFPQETLADILQTYLFLARCAWIGVDDASIATFCPYPGSELFTELQRRGRIPTLDDDYWFSLTTMGDASQAVSYSEHLSGRTLLLAKVGAIVLFYALSYLRRPGRIFQTLYRLWSGDHRTRVEKALSALVSKLRRVRRLSVT